MFDSTMASLTKVLDLRVRKHEMHVSNIANANVPNFKAKAMDFNEEMAKAIEKADISKNPQIATESVLSEALSSVEPHVYEDPSARLKGDGNTVNAEKEQVELAKNTLAYQTALQILNKKFSMQKSVLGEGGR